MAATSSTACASLVHHAVAACGSSVAVVSTAAAAAAAAAVVAAAAVDEELVLLLALTLGLGLALVLAPARLFFAELARRSCCAATCRLTFWAESSEAGWRVAAVVSLRGLPMSAGTIGGAVTAAADAAGATGAVGAAGGCGGSSGAFTFSPVRGALRRRLSEWMGVPGPTAFWPALTTASTSARAFLWTPSAAAGDAVALLAAAAVAAAALGLGLGLGLAAADGAALGLGFATVVDLAARLALNSASRSRCERALSWHGAAPVGEGDKR